MKTNSIIIYACFLIGITGFAQEKKTMSLKEAISIVITNSNEAVLANTKVTTSQLELETMKNNQYPSAKVSGQYMRLTNANVTSHLGGAGSGLDVSQLLIGQANVAMPVFSGFKLKTALMHRKLIQSTNIFFFAHQRTISN